MKELRQLHKLSINDFFVLKSEMDASINPESE